MVLPTGLMETPLRGLAAEFQLGCVVADMHAAARSWTAMFGIGPWIAVDGYPGFRVRWKEREADIGIAVAFGYWGDVQVELIEPLPGMPSPYRDFLEAGGDGFHHLGLLCEDYEAAMAAADAAGMTSAFELLIPGSDRRTVYFDAPAGMGTVVEIVDLTPARRRAFAAIRDAARGWDGSDPFRCHASMSDFMAGR